MRLTAEKGGHIKMGDFERNNLSLNSSVLVNDNDFQRL